MGLSALVTAFSRWKCIRFRNITTQLAPVYVTSFPSPYENVSLLGCPRADSTPDPIAGD
jgi:hypothetical protein